MPRGGRRSGKSGGSYPNRSDLQTAPDPGASTFKGQPYGAATQQAATAAAPGSAGGGSPPIPPPTGPPPGAQGAFTRPTERPGEPIQHGLPMGPGGGPEVLGGGAGDPNNPALIQLRALYAKFPNQELADLLTDMSTKGG